MTLLASSAGIWKERQDLTEKQTDVLLSGNCSMVNSAIPADCRY
jgi:hypothetical protein